MHYIYYVYEIHYMHVIYYSSSDTTHHICICMHASCMLQTMRIATRTTYIFHLTHMQHTVHILHTSHIQHALYELCVYTRAPPHSYAHAPDTYTYISTRNTYDMHKYVAYAANAMYTSYATTSKKDPVHLSTFGSFYVFL